MRLEYQRRRMVKELAEGYGIRDRRVLDAMLEVPRHRFVRAHLEGQAYGDFPLPIGEDQTISQPYVVALMTEWLQVGPEHTVLEIGTGSGYQTAILAKLAYRVYSLERLDGLARTAIQRMRELSLDNVKIQTFDGTVGWSQAAPFDRILVTAGAPAPPPPLLDQLAVGGRLVIPEGKRDTQRVVSYRKLKAGGAKRRVGPAVSFVPLLGRHGWATEADTR